MNSSSTRSALLELLGTSHRDSDPVHARVAAAHPRTHSEELQTSISRNHPTAQPATHPGDILYWIACLGGASLLLLFSTR